MFSAMTREHQIMNDQPQLELLRSLSSLFQSKEFSDCIIIAKDGSRYPAHKALLCPRSTYIATVVKEEKWHEGVTGDIAMLDDDPSLTGMVLEYLYLLEYHPPAKSPSMQSLRSASHDTADSETISIRTDPIHFGNMYGGSAVTAFGGPTHHHSPINHLYNHDHNRTGSQLTVHAIPGVTDFSPGHSPASHRRGSRNSTRTPEPSPLATAEPNLSLHAKMYAAGEQYGIAGLKALSLDKFKIQLTRHWNHADLAEAIHIVFNTTPPTDKEMRETVADTISWHKELLEKPEIEIAIMEINGLAYELLKRSRRGYD